MRACADHQIGQLVYELYGLTEEEVKIVEDLTQAKINEEIKP